MDATDDEIEVEIVYCGSTRQWGVRLRVPAGTTVAEAIKRSGIADQAPEIDLARQTVGIFGQPVDLRASVAPGDRIEIYRPLAASPRDRRRAKAGTGSAGRGRGRGDRTAH